MNLDNPILSQDGGRYYGVGGPTAYKTFTHRGYCCSLEWVDGEPAMLIWSARGGMDSGVFGICLSSAGKYADPSGDITPAGYAELIHALPVLGKPLLEIEAKTLRDCVLLWMPDLLHMPYCPTEVRLADRKPALWEITHKDQNGKVLSEASI
jgi:hypothetical protein